MSGLNQILRGKVSDRTQPIKRGKARITYQKRCLQQAMLPTHNKQENLVFTVNSD